MRKLCFCGLLFFFFAAACTPVSLTKCIKEYKYDDKNRVVSEYSECINQTPEKTTAIHLKHQELYD
jgi:hypothetical protein